MLVINILATLMLVIFVITVAVAMATITFTSEVEPLKVNYHEGFMERA